MRNDNAEITYRMVADMGGEERLDLFLTRSLDGVSRKNVKRALDSGRILVNEQVVNRAGHLLKGGERIVAKVISPHSRHVPKVDIIFRDDHLLAVCKPPGLLSHGHAKGQPSALSQVSDLLGEGFQPVLQHRLDKETSGILLFTLNDLANRSLYRQISERRVRKEYLALVTGDPPPSFRVCDRLKAGIRGRTRVVNRGGQEAQTEFATRFANGRYALVAAFPQTGRTHQIRAHLASRGFSLLGDALYDGSIFVQKGLDQFAIPRHLLHALRLDFLHPATGRSMQLEALLPDDFRHALAKLLPESLPFNF